MADVYFDTSVTAANKPTGTTAFRRIGGFLTNGSAQIVPYFQNGDNFSWDVPVSDLTNTVIPDTSAHLLTLSVPTGVSVTSLMNWRLAIASNSVFVLLTSPAQTDTAPTGTLSSFSLSVDINQSGGNGVHMIATNTSGQTRYRSSTADGSAQFSETTIGWIDHRGRDA